MERRFVDLSEKQIAALLEADSLPWFGRSHGVVWTDLLRSPRIIIISEAGSGKTYECQTQQEKVFGEGAAAFFLELSELAREQNVVSLLTPEEKARFEDWATSSDLAATFFLDAYDELKLTHGKFRTALLNLRNFIGARLERVQLIVTSRPVPFERAILRQLFPVPEPRTETPNFVDDVMGTSSSEVERVEQARAPSTWRTVGLVPLDEASIREIAIENGLANADEFLADISERDALEFARRPQDLIELCQDWREHRRIRSHREQVETNVVVKLKPRNDRAELASLSEIKAREGAGDLALAALLTRRLTIRHGADADGDNEDDPALDPGRILPHWSNAERQTLLERPLFSYSSYGRVRFHHRSVLEYLASERLASLRKSGMTLRALKRLLFAHTAQNLDVVRPSLRPVAAWLSLRDSDVFQATLWREPGNAD